MPDPSLVGNQIIQRKQRASRNGKPESAERMSVIQKTGGEIMHPLNEIKIKKLRFLVIIKYTVEIKMLAE